MLGATAHRKIFAMLVLISVVAKYNGYNGGGNDSGHGDATVAAVAYMPIQSERCEKAHARKGIETKSSSSTDAVGLATHRPWCLVAGG